MENEVHPRPFSWFRSVLVPLAVGIAANIGCVMVIFPLLQHETLSPLGALVLLSGLNIVIVSIVALVQTLMGIRPMHKKLVAMAEQQAKVQTEIEAKVRAELQERFRSVERDLAEARARGFLPPANTK